MAKRYVVISRQQGQQATVRPVSNSQYSMSGEKRQQTATLITDPKTGKTGVYLPVQGGGKEIRIGYYEIGGAPIPPVQPAQKQIIQASQGGVSYMDVLTGQPRPASKSIVSQITSRATTEMLSPSQTQRVESLIERAGQKGKISAAEILSSKNPQAAIAQLEKRVSGGYQITKQIQSDFVGPPAPLKGEAKAQALIDKYEAAEKKIYGMKGFQRIKDVSSYVTGGGLMPIESRSKGGQLAQLTVEKAIGAVPYGIAAGTLAVGKGVLALRVYQEYPPSSKAIFKEIKRAAKETPKTVGQAFDPRTAEGLSNILVTGGFVLLGGSKPSTAIIRKAAKQKIPMSFTTRYVKSKITEPIKTQAIRTSGITGEEVLAGYKQIGKKITVVSTERATIGKSVIPKQPGAFVSYPTKQSIQVQQVNWFKKPQAVISYVRPSGKTTISIVDLTKNKVWKTVQTTGKPYKFAITEPKRILEKKAMIEQPEIRQVIKRVADRSVSVRATKEIQPEVGIVRSIQRSVMARVDRPAYRTELGKPVYDFEGNLVGFEWGVTYPQKTKFKFVREERVQPQIRTIQEGETIVKTSPAKFTAIQREIIRSRGTITYPAAKPIVKLGKKGQIAFLPPLSQTESVLRINFLKSQLQQQIRFPSLYQVKVPSSVSSSIFATLGSVGVSQVKSSVQRGTSLLMPRMEELQINIPQRVTVPTITQRTEDSLIRQQIIFQPSQTKTPVPVTQTRIETIPATVTVPIPTSITTTTVYVPIPTPPIYVPPRMPPIIPPFLMPGGGGGYVQRRRQKLKAFVGSVYTPDFTATALDIRVRIPKVRSKKGGKAKLKSLLRRQFTGLEVRPIIQ